MNKNAIFLFIIIAAIAAFSLFNAYKKEEAPVQAANPAANPANGLVAPESKKPEAATDTQANPPEVMTLTPSAPAANAQPAAPVGQPAAPTGADDVPASAEVAPAPAAAPTANLTTSPSQPQSAPAATAPAANPAGMAVPASEGQ
jgi:ribonuclease E